MKRGVFLLILNFIEEKVVVRKSVFKKRKMLNKKIFNRYSIEVNGKNVIVLDLTINDLCNENVLSLLKIYKRRVLVSEKYNDSDILKDYVYIPKEYYQRALLSSLVNQIKTVNKEWKNIYIKTEFFSPFKELYELVRISKTVSIITEPNSYTEKFLNDCYYEYGAIVNVKEDYSILKNGVCLDLDEIDSNGKLMININGKDFLLYPDMRYYENRPEYQILSPYNIEHRLICSAFSNK